MPEDVEGGVGEPMREGICDTTDDIELDSNEEEHIESGVLLSVVVPQQAEQLPAPPTPAAARKRALTSEFLSAFRQPKKTKKKGKR